MSYSELYYDRLQLEYDGTQIWLAPNFLCPMCAGRPQSLVGQTWNIPVNRKIDVNPNQQVTFIMPCCNTPITLYVAVYKESGSMNVKNCISVVPIPEDWYVSHDRAKPT
jgi:hypothetical protein